MTVQLPGADTHTMPPLAFSPDGNSLAVLNAGGVNRAAAPGARLLNDIRIWHVADSREMRAAAAVKTGTGTAAVLAVSPDQHLLAAAGGGEIWLADVRNPHQPRLLATIRTPGPVDALAFSPGSGLLAAGAEDSAGSTLIVADVSGLLSHPGTPPVTRLAYPLSPFISALTFGPGGFLLAAGDASRNVVIFTLFGRAAAPVARVQAPGAVSSLAFIANSHGSLLAATSQQQYLDLWDVSKLAAIHHVGAEKGLNVITDLASPAGTGLLASTGEDDLLRIWAASKTHGLTQIRAERDTGELLAVSASPDGRRLATLSTDQTARVYNLAGSKPVHAGQRQGGR
jgi:WD40 repeat protein